MSEPVYSDTDLRLQALLQAVDLGKAIIESKAGGNPVTDASIVGAAQLFYEFLKARGQ